MADTNRRVEHHRTPILKGVCYFKFIDIKVDQNVA